MAAKASFYAVAKGRITGIYNTWDACKQQVEGFTGAKFKKFSTKAAADNFIKSSTSNSDAIKPTPIMKKKDTNNTFYAVAKGKQIGIFTNWDDCKKNVNGFPGAIYKRFNSGHEAQQFMKSKISEFKSPDDSIATKASRNASFYGVNFKDGKSKIFDNWKDCQKATSGVQGTTFKSFDSYEKALNFTGQGEKIELKEEEKASIIKQYLVNHTKEELKTQKDQVPLIVFTDGSFLENKYGGIGIYYGADDTRNYAAAFPECRSSYSAEVLAITTALRRIQREIDEYKNETIRILPKYAISSDNHAAVSILRDYSTSWSESDTKKREEGELVYEMIKLYNDIKKFYKDNQPLFDDHLFEIKWIKGHDGEIGNEMADLLAGQGSQHCKSTIT
ncbi:hypothetical protein WICMUC_005352 [Wickerhamomyces mucosus]|uniref:Ribonuclease H n=1 Tax=Wickerhamomyces mucosus TaxID=1378264 RepID=A0A9P8P875_9ASCO|nr:hypothetical protein WICMUC_005352 [Wickerhamomyces mucosus]